MNDFGLLVGQYLSSLPSLSDTEMSELMLDSKGRLIISGRYLEDEGHSSGDAGIFALAVRDDGVLALGSITVVDYSQLTGDTVTVGGTVLTEGVEWTAATDNNTTAASLASAISALSSVNATSSLAVISIVAATPGLAGNSITLATSDAVNLTLSGAVLSGGADDTIFTSANYDYSPIAVDKYGRLKVLADIDVDFDYVYPEDSAFASGNLGAYVLAVRQDTLATDTSLSGDFSSFKVNAKGELYVKDTDAKAVLDTIKTDTGNMDTSLNNIETDIDNLARAEDAQAQSGEYGIMALAVRKDAAGSLVSNDGDYSALQLDANGALRVTGNISVTITPPGSEEFVVTDALAAAGDGLIVITAAATPWITVASFAHTTGTAYLYAYQWACDQNAAMRIVTDDTSNIVVYKHDINSSAMPGTSESWSESGRIEIAGAALLEIKMQVKKRSATGGNGNGSGSMHIRK